MWVFGIFGIEKHNFCDNKLAICNENLNIDQVMELVVKFRSEIRKNSLDSLKSIKKGEIDCSDAFKSEILKYMNCCDSLRDHFNNKYKITIEDLPGDKSVWRKCDKA